VSWDLVDRTVSKLALLEVLHRQRRSTKLVCEAETADAGRHCSMPTGEPASVGHWKIGATNADRNNLPGCFAHNGVQHHAGAGAS